MAIPLKNRIYDKIKESGSLTDSELIKALKKDGFLIAEDRFKKLLLDLEIMGLIKVSWLSKDTKRIEIVRKEAEEDEVDAQNREMMERDYEASFPGAESASS